MLLPILIAIPYSLAAGNRTILLGEDPTGSTKPARTEGQPPPLDVYRQAYFEMIMESFWEDEDGSRVLEGPSILMFKAFQDANPRVRIEKVPTQSKGVSRNGTYDGEIGLLQSGRADISSTTLYFTHDRYAFLDYTVPVAASPHCIAVRRAPFMSFRYIVQFPFQRATWAALVATLLAACGAWHAVHTSSGHNGRAWQWAWAWAEGAGDAAVGVAQVALTGGWAGAEAGRARRPPVRLLLAGLLLGAVVLQNAYVGQLLGFMTAPPRLPDPQTLHEVRGLRQLFAQSVLHDVYSAAGEGHPLRAIARNLRVIRIDEVRRALLDAARGAGDTGVVLSRALFEYHASARAAASAAGERRLHLVAECVNAPGHLAFAARKRHAAFRPLNRFVARALQAGLHARWARAAARRRQARGLALPALPPPAARPPRPLRAQQLVSAFALAALGHAAAAAAFAGELLLAALRARCAR